MGTTTNTKKYIIKIDETDYISGEDTLIEIKYQNKIYSPGYLEFTLKCSKDTNHLGKQVQLTNSEYDTNNNKITNSDINLAEKFYIFEQTLQEKIESSSTSYYITFKAYSPDKFLTIDKYCKSYTGKKLFNDIYLGTLKTYTNNQNFTSYNKSGISAKSHNFRFLKYNVETTDGEGNPITEKIEYILPYSIQYNESFYDFFARIMHRCGEFLYYDKGELHIGLPNISDSEIISIGKYTSLQTNTFKSSSGTTASIYTDYTLKKEEQMYKSTQAEDLYYNVEYATDEYLTPLKKEDFTNWEEFASFPKKAYITMVAAALNEPTLTDMIAKFGIDHVIKFSSAKVLSDTTNNKHKESYFGKSIPERMNEDETELSQFSTYNSPLNLDFYSIVRQKEEQLAKQKIYIDLGENLPVGTIGTGNNISNKQIYIGSIITVNNINYIVIQMDISFTKGSVASHKIVAIPYDKGNNKIYPPLCDYIPHIKTSAPQTATITANTDPLRMERVRIRYPWQPNIETEASPWIRLSTPMASNKSGVRFLPVVGDEVLVNYMNGNIERPYVVGSLFSQDRKALANHLTTERSITSRNGHSIRFKDPNVNTFAAKFQPFTSLLSSFIPTTMSTGNDLDQLKLSGGIEMTDSYGFYSISMSTDERKIAISCPLGKVDINAFTGITISAPNGNVKIAGKNVEIVAGNNLTITSGNNIVNALRRDVPDPGLYLMKPLTAVITRLEKMVIDMSSIRTLMETFLRPIGGTMLIKSHRYMCLEAGKGKTTILNALHRKKISTKKYTLKSFENIFVNSSLEYFSVNDLRNARNFLEKTFAKHKKAYNICLYMIGALNDISRQNNNIYPEDEMKEDLKKIIRAATKESSFPESDANNDVLKAAREGLFQCIYAAHEDKIFETAKRETALTDKLYNHLIKKEPLVKELYDEMYILGYNPDHLINSYEVFWVLRDTNYDKKIVNTILYNILNKFQEDFLIRLNIDGEINTDNIDRRWNDIIDNITPRTNQFDKSIANYTIPFAKSIYLDSLRTASGFKGFLDQNVWDQSATGEILFSNTATRTLHFDQETIKKYEENRETDFNSLKDYLVNIR